ncbi:hypothetical protein [Arthrobacter glacialis]|uniref:hypothetical protein n=1 Tax=Arthrobacter glacialis TaxID=1664 RepID=UPI000CD47EAF|nr:hypothetical protein [Arthrobacter glacialis]POH58925.1 hypothetical protein CVS28_09465 [Arthrobacter glacialis]
MAAVKDALDPSWINAPGGVGPSYDAEELRRLQGYQLVGGATAGSSRTGILNVRDLDLSLSGSNVLAGPGGCVIGTAKGAYVAGVAAVTIIGALVAADVTNPRRDRVVLEILDPDNGGGAGRKAQLRIIDGTPNASAATGGGFPAAPTSPFIDLGYADMPKSGAGSPSITITAPLTAAAGAPILVRTLAERDALPKWNGLMAYRMDRGGVDICDGTKWSPVSTALHVEYTGPAQVAASNEVWGMGARTRTVIKGGDPAFSATVGTGDVVNVRDEGLYLVAVTAAFTTAVSGRSYVQFSAGDVTARASIASGEDRGTVSRQVWLQAGTAIVFSIHHGSGGNKTFTGHLAITRIG